MTRSQNNTPSRGRVLPFPKPRGGRGPSGAPALGLAVFRVEMPGRLSGPLAFGALSSLLAGFDEQMAAQTAAALMELRPRDAACIRASADAAHEEIA